ncbi:uncharacterized protein PGTG_15799 [Puccinia graminis f. sp. tritici CRL 75-36-700-3]|uniref:Uncharacterized protein n=1 Tax=Puccinia graminis f. sp. tritici (strain CRL 75-36-700-3 / race SCCL) TaxID=418459 RepID=E3KZW2_PUCGT|nr:uncharacterized protein PGTG_15799 [Puccinia graminis f. sp. tritici CRL 75-36-700-3]EFP89843.2 hypothetical protein PGTG_15799 [Puccinia graminis f. sp. tritici CRL 75-36-700-3]
MVQHSRERVSQKFDRSLWYQLPGEKRDKWFCRLCGGGGRGSMAANRPIHESKPGHKAELLRQKELAQANKAAADLLARGPPEMQWTSAHDEPPAPPSPSVVSTNELHADLQFIDQDECFNDPEIPQSRASSESRGSSESGGWDGLIPEDFPPMGDPTAPEAETARQACPRRVPNQDWWPFRAKEYLVSCLLIGHTRTIISREMYQHVRSMFELCGTLLPDWTTVRRGKGKLRKMIGMDVIGRRSVLNRPVHYLSLQKTLALEISNPVVEPHLKYYPEISAGQAVSRLSQSRKWLKELGPNTRAPMVRHGCRDFYLHELVQLKSSLIVVPEFFCELDGEMYALCQTPEIEICNETGQLLFKITKNPPFDSPKLSRIAVAEFGVEYPSMTVDGGGLMSDLCGNRLYELGTESEVIGPIFNRWRLKAAGRVIRHMPICLYADDTSGNSSKKWNKHISYYFTLAGLPPKLTNQHFNCHFLSTSNSAGAMELAEGIVDELITLTEKGCVAYDCGLGEEVLITSSLLCFLADSPMHAEITSTVMPGNSRNPCRACDLSVSSVSMKKTMAYLQFFLQISADGYWIKNGPRSWMGIIANCYLLWDISKQPRTKTRVGVVGGDLGVKDSVNNEILLFKYTILAKGDSATPANQEFIRRIAVLDQTDQTRLFNPFFRLPEVLHVFLLGVVKYMVRDVMARAKPAQLGDIEGWYRSFRTTSLNIPSLSPNYMAKHSSNFVGKEFKVVLQSAPFVLFEMFDDDERLAWGALCELAPLIFQTRIEDMDSYLADLRFHIQKFLYYIIRTTAQWINKPKFHMLLHLPESVERFGPASLFATEKFESYNGVLRNASIHSNRQSPGKDIAITFANFKVIRHLTCGGYFEHPKHPKVYITSSSGVAQLFKNNSRVQKSMDYNEKVASVEAEAPYPLNIRLPLGEQRPIPPPLQVHLPGRQLSQLVGIQLNAHRALRKDVFILVRSAEENTLHSVGCVDHIWQARKKSGVSYWVCYTEYERGNVDKFYNMRKVVKTGITKFVRIKHNCHAGGCEVTSTGRVCVEREESEENNKTVTHKDTVHYVVNSMEIPGARGLRLWVDIPRGEEEVGQLIPMLQRGLAVWRNTGEDEGPEEEYFDDPLA